jgi:5-methylcytosine-specific restriction endonuclease McrA
LAVTVEREQDKARHRRRYLSLNTVQWRAIRKAQLERFPLCAHCGQPANEVDHIENDSRKNLIGRDLQSLCKSCHSRKTRAEMNQAQGLTKQQNHGQPSARNPHGCLHTRRRRQDDEKRS